MNIWILEEVHIRTSFVLTHGEFELHAYVKSGNKADGHLECELYSVHQHHHHHHPQFGVDVVLRDHHDHCDHHHHNAVIQNHPHLSQ